MTRCFAVLFALALASGCTTMTPADCGSADWQDVGYEDGLKGMPDRLDNRRQACARSGVEPETSALETYDRGWNEGLAGYCGPANGFIQGRRGKEYLGVCGKDVEPAFLEAYSDGRRIAGIQRNLAVATFTNRYYPYYSYYTARFGFEGPVVRR